MANEKLECPMCGKYNAFTIDPLDGSRGYCEVEDKVWCIRVNEGRLSELLAQHRAGDILDGGEQ
jgi:hypothetical protein